jgi:prepilin-type N-terminal cleavage/methylation domain-containing protein
MPKPSAHPGVGASRHGSRGFTLTELLVAIGIIALLSTLTVVSVKSLSNEARLSSGRNAVVAALGAARAFAMKNNQIVLVAIRPVLDDQGRNQYAEMWLMEWTGETYTAGSTANPTMLDRFVPVSNASVTRLPRGIKVAGPLYADDSDELWVTQSQLTAINQSQGYGAAGGQSPTPAQAGEIIGIMYAPDGTTMTHNPLSDSHRNWPDFDNDGACKRNGVAITPGAGIPSFPGGGNPPFNLFFQQTFFDDEPNVNIVPFLAVYDDAAARELAGDDDWSDQTVYDAELREDATGYISKYADRIHFNRYTGVIMK